jgi:hypothetical protein
MKTEKKMEFFTVIILAVGLGFAGCAETKLDVPEVQNLETKIVEKKVDNESPLLTKPKIAKIKIESYIDSDGDYHESSKLHLKIIESAFTEDKKYFSINKE